MDILQLIKNRREITKFQNREVPQDIVDRLVQALYLSPSGNNLPSREFILVKDRKMLQQLSTTSPFMPWLEQAALGVVITGRPDVSKYWLQDATIAGAYLWLAVVAEGLGAAWGAVYHSEDAEECFRRENHARKLLQIPGHHRVVAIIGIGYPDMTPKPKKLYPLETVFHQEHYQGQE